MIRHARIARSATAVVATLLSVAFIWLKLKGVDFGEVAKNVPAKFIFELSMAVYYFSWIFGINNDTQEQELVFIQPPKNVVLACVVFGLLFFAMFGALCYADTPGRFAVALLIFLAVNVIAWQFYIKIFLKSSARATRSQHRSDQNYVGEVRFTIVFDEYLCGRWQWARFAVGGVFVGVICALAFGDAVRQRLEELQPGIIDTLIPTFLMLYVLVIEGWMWGQRLSVKNRLSFLDDVQQRFTLKPKEGRRPRK